MAEISIGKTRFSKPEDIQAMSDIYRSLRENSGCCAYRPIIDELFNADYAPATRTYTVNDEYQLSITLDLRRDLVECLSCTVTRNGRELFSAGVDESMQDVFLYGTLGLDGTVDELFEQYLRHVLYDIGEMIFPPERDPDEKRFDWVDDASIVRHAD